MAARRVMVCALALMLGSMPAWARFDMTKPINGEIMRIEGNTVTLGVGDSKREILLAIEPETVITLNGNKAKWSDMHAGFRTLVTIKDGVCQKFEAMGQK